MFNCDFKIHQEYYEPLYNRRYFVITKDEQVFLLVPSSIPNDDEIIIVRVKRIIRALEIAYGVPRAITDAEV